VVGVLRSVPSPSASSRLRTLGIVVVATFSLALVLGGCEVDRPANAAAAPTPAPGPGLAGPVTVAARRPRVQRPPGPISIADGEWPLPGRDPRGTRFSPLAQISGTNVGSLRAAWTFSTGTTRGQEAAPLVVKGTLYYVTPYPNILYALDLTREGAPLKWKFEPNPSPASQGVACCDVVNRGAAYADGTVFFNTLDGKAVAVDAQTGAAKWITQLGDINKGETITMAPLVVRGKVLVGNSGGEMGVRGWLVALDAASGKIAWRAYSTGPDSDVLIGSEFHPYYNQDKGKDLGVQTWPPQMWQIGGGTVWGWVTYDPATDVVFYGTANPGAVEPRPAPRRQQVDVHRVRAPALRRPCVVGRTRSTRTTRTTTTASTRASSSTCRSRGRCGRCCCGPSATATFT
jgi:glucose dehydrogenase